MGRYLVLFEPSSWKCRLSIQLLDLWSSLLVEGTVGGGGCLGSCSEGFCGQGGECVDPEGDSPACFCHAGYTGARCEVDLFTKGLS